MDLQGDVQLGTGTISSLLVATSFVVRRPPHWCDSFALLLYHPITGGIVAHLVPRLRLALWEARGLNESAVPSWGGGRLVGTRWPWCR